MYQFKKNKISLGVLVLVLSLSANAQNTVENLILPAQLLIDKKQTDKYLTGLYNIEFNKQFKILAEISSDNENIYIPLNFLDEKLKSKFKFNDAIINKDGIQSIAINKSLITNVDNNEMLMSVVLDNNYFNDSTTVKKISYVDRTNDLVDTKNVVNYFSNNYQVYIDDGNYITGYLNTKYSNKDYWSIQNQMLYNSSKLIRLSTSYKKEFSNKSALQIGDIVEDSIGQIASANGFGIKYSTNYFVNNLNANLANSLPQYSINGFSLTPSMFNLYSSSNSLISNEISSGNYNVIMPYNNGYGTYSGYVRDYLGNIQQFDIPYYNSTKLVKENNWEYSVSAAKIRINQYTHSFDYDKPFVSAIAKYGVNKNWTQDFSVHHSSYFKNIYTGANFYLNPSWGLFKAGINYNGSNQRLYNAGWEYTSNSPFVFRLESSFSDNSSGYCVRYINDCIKKQNRYFMGYKLPEKMGLISFQHLEEEKTSFGYSSNSLNWSKNINNRLNFTLMYEQLSYRQGKDEKRVLALLNYSFDDKWSGNVNYQNNSNNNSIQTRIARAEDKENPHYGYGYLNVTNSQNRTNYNLNYYANLDKFSYNVQAYSRNHKTGYRAGIRGASIYIPEDNYLSFNKDTTGIILVDTDKKTDEYTPIEIYHQNKISGSTDNDGKYIITKASPYSTEKIEINLKTLPLDKNYEQFKFNVVVPEYGAAKVQFKQLMGDYNIIVKNLSKGAIFTIGSQSYVVDKDGQATVDTEGIANFVSDSKSCAFDVKRNQKEYVCE